MPATLKKPLGPGSSNIDEAAAAFGKLRTAGAKAVANPETHAAPVKATPAHPPKDPVTGKFTKAETPAPDATITKPAAEPEGEAPESTPADEAEVDQPETPDGEFETLPDTLDGLAEALGLTTEDLLKSIKHKVKVSGKDVEVVLEEAIKGYSRLEDYKAKTADVSEKDKALEAERQRITAERQHYATQLEPMLRQLGDRLRAEDVRLQAMLNPESPTFDPQQYVIEKARFDNEARQFQAAAFEHERVRQLNDADQRRQFEADVKKHEELLFEAIPDWKKDPKKGEAEIKAIKDYAVSQGLSKDRVASVYEAPLLLMGRKAMLYDKIQSEAVASVKKVQNLPKYQAPGKAKPKVDPKVAVRRNAMDRLRKTGKVRDAAAAIAALRRG